MRGRFLIVWAALLTVSAAEAGQSNAGLPLKENQASYLARCRTETIARFPNARAKADSICQSRWEQIAAAGGMADTILTAAPQAGVAFNPTAAKGALSSVRWAARPAQGSVASGSLGDIAVLLPAMPRGITLQWFKEGEPIPFDVEEALRLRGATLAMIGCLAFGSADDTKVYRVTMAGKSPFALTVARREAAVASQSSDYSVISDFSGRMPSLAELRRDGSEWGPTCPQ